MRSGFPLGDRFSPLQRYFLTALFCIVSAFGLTFFADDLDHANIVMPLLLVVLLVCESRARLRGFLGSFMRQPL
jgi:hypothetical protein